MANHEISEIAWNVVRNIGSGSMQLLGNPVFPALIGGTFFSLSHRFSKTISNISEQAQDLISRRLYADPGSNQPPLPHPSHGIVCRLLSQWKLGSSSTTQVGYQSRWIMNQIFNGRDLVGRRYYNVDRHNQAANYHHYFRYTTPNRVDDDDDDGDFVETSSTEKRPKRSYLMRALITVLAGLGATAYSSNLETVPYSKRTRLMFISRMLEKESGEKLWKGFKEKNKDKILPETHPMSVRVGLITNRVIEGLERGLRDDKVWGAGPIYALSTWKRAFRAVLEGQQSVKESRATQYLSHIESWEVVVVEEPTINAVCSPGGKIVVNTGLLQYFESDAEVASIIAHEVAHAVARHCTERTIRFWGLLIPQLLISHDFNAAVTKTRTHPLILSFSRELELEADYIGLLLMASAGYHPRVGLAVEEEFAKLESLQPESENATHPSGKRRVELIARAQEKAMAFYREAQSLSS